MAVLQASEVSDSSVRLRAQTGEPGPSAGSAEAGEGSVVNGNESAKSGDLESVAKKPGDSAEAPAADSANVAGIALPLVSISGVPTAPGAVVVSDGALESEVTTVLASGATAKAVELAQAAALWANGGLKDGSAEAALDPSSLSDQGDRSSSAATSVNVLSTPQGSTISGVMDPALFAAPGAGVGSTASVDGATAGASGASAAAAPMSVDFAGSPIGLSGASAALQGAVQGTGQSAANNALLSNGRLEASLAGVGTGVGATGQRAASSANSAAVSVASALAAAATARSAQSSASSDSVGLSATAGSITGTLSVSLMSGSAGADLGGSTLGSQTGGAGSESGASSGGSRSGSSNAFIVQAANLSEPSVVAALPGAPETSARSFRSVGLGSYPTATANSSETTKAASVSDVAATQPPIVDVNVPAPQAAAS